MATQTEKAENLGMFQSDYSKWKKRIAQDLESCMKQTPLKMIKAEGYTIKLVKINNQ